MIFLKRRDDHISMEMVQAQLASVTLCKVISGHTFSLVSFGCNTSYRKEMERCGWSHCDQLVKTSIDMHIDLLRSLLALKVTSDVT